MVFEDLGIFAKWGITVSIAEAQSVYAVRKLLGDVVPVPEVYGWRTDGTERFLYMEYVKGQTLEEVWGTMNSEERESICRQLRGIVDNLRRLEQDPSDSYIGLIALFRCGKINNLTDINTDTPTFINRNCLPHSPTLRQSIPHPVHVRSWPVPNSP